MIMMIEIKKVNPARAGMIPIEYAIEAATKGKPRASGDDPSLDKRRLSLAA